ncbi:uracil phosphoribosyltransferase [Candidatus Uhrbacteria bacterium]|nr:uracil phosphoribosyltransferase [Candidatus Uhrbacteria bacterium]
MLKLLGGNLAADLLLQIRDEDTPNWLTEGEEGGEGSRFNLLIGEITRLLLAEVSDLLPLRLAHICTGVEDDFDVPGRVDGYMVDVGRLCVVSIRRAGDGMLPPIQFYFRGIKCWFVDIHRDERTARPIEGIHDLPASLIGMTVLIVDPALATGGTLAATIQLLKAKGAEKIIFLGVLGAASGVERIERKYTNVTLCLGGIDSVLTTHPDRNAFIYPGLGDAGDKQFGPNPHHVLPRRLDGEPVVEVVGELPYLEPRSDPDRP